MTGMAEPLFIHKNGERCRGALVPRVAGAVAGAIAGRREAAGLPPLPLVGAGDSPSRPAHNWSAITYALLTLLIVAG
jgi:hypothetical protein